MSATKDLLDEIEAFLAQQGMNPTQFGELALRERSFVARLRKGSDVRMGTAEKVRRFMRDWRPPNPKLRAA